MMNLKMCAASVVYAFLALGSAIPMPSQPPKRIWTVISDSRLDPRLRKEIASLAQRESAIATFAVSRPLAASEPAKSDHLVIELLAKDAADPWPPEMDREGYRLVATYLRDSALSKVQIRAATPAGFHFGLLRIPQLTRVHSEISDDIIRNIIPAPQNATVSRSADIITLTISDFPSFPERGIVEGFYGKPWSHQDRLDILRFQGEHRMNVYYYAPKDDPYHRERWNSPYPPREYRRLGELAKTARANFVDFCFAISPALSMQYSSENDFQKLAGKLESVGKLGVSCFALFLDDVSPDLENKEDLKHFKNLAEAHASLINKLYNHLKAQSKRNRLVVTPTTYTNAWGRRDYIAQLGPLVHREIPLVWTGIDTFAPEITRTQASQWGELIWRPPLVWDKFPVNDSDPWRPHLGPLSRRGPDLDKATQGLFANPMNQARASMIPLATVADYLWNPAAYRPEESHAQAVRDQYGEDGAKLLDPFLKTYADNEWDDNLFTPLFYSRRYPMDIPLIEKRLDELDQALREISAIPRFKRIAEELAPFIPRTRKRLGEVLASPAFTRLPDGRLAPREDYDLMEAPRISPAPALDGNFSKWESGNVMTLDQKSQIMRGADRWRGPDGFSVRAALAWDSQYLYVGLDVTDPDLYQPFVGRGIPDGDFFSVTLQTAFRKNYNLTNPTGDEYRIFFSPGNFGNVPPSLFSDEDYLGPRNRPQDHAKEIRMAWLKTPRGYSGDIAIPVSYFEGGAFREGYEIGLGFAVQNTARRHAGKNVKPRLDRVMFISKRNSLFPVYLGNPSSYPRLSLVR